MYSRLVCVTALYTPTRWYQVFTVGAVLVQAAPLAPPDPAVSLAMKLRHQPPRPPLYWRSKPAFCAPSCAAMVASPLGSELGSAQALMLKLPAVLSTWPEEV